MAGSGSFQENAKRIVLVAAVVLSVVIALFVAGALSYAAANGLVDRTLQIQRTADQWLAALLDAETGARGYLLVGEPVFLEPFEAATVRERDDARRIRALVADNPLQSENVKIADQHALDAVAHLKELVALVRDGRHEEAIVRMASGESKREMDTFRDDVDRICRGEGRILGQRRSTARFRASMAATGGVLLSITSLFLLGAAWSIQKDREKELDRLASEARARLGALSDMAVALSNARTREQVAKVVVEQGLRASGADACTLYTLDDTGTALELIGEHGVAPAVRDAIRRIPEDAGGGEVFATLRAGETIFAESEAEYARRFPELAGLKSNAPRAKAFWRVPLVGEGGAVGLLGMGFYEPRRFSKDERLFVETLTKQCAQALLRASRLEREDEARRWFTTTLRSIGDAVIATDAGGRVTFMNPVAEELTGWTESEARFRPLDVVFNIVSEITGEPIESPVARVLREGTVVGLANHTVLRSKSGVRIPIDDSGAPIRGEGGHVFGVVLVFRDVRHEKTDRVRREFLAKAGEALVSSVDYQTTLSNIARLTVPTLADWCSVDIVDPTTNVQRRAATAHVDPEKVRVAEELGRRYPPDPSATVGAPNVIRTGKSELYRDVPEDLLGRVARDAEHARLLRKAVLDSAMVVPLRARGRTVGAMTFVYAGSARKYTEEDLTFAEDFARRAALAIENAGALKETETARARERLLRDQAEAASRAKDEFLAMVSHELRTPLTAILGWAVTLRGRNPAPDVERALAVIERNARAQAKLIDDVLDVSRIVSGNLSLAIGPTDIGQVVAASIETVMPAADAKSITIAVQVAPGSLTILADAERVQQIVWNLLSNAVKFTGKGGHVSIEVARDGSDLSIRVRDDGEGIQPDAQPYIFEPFRQADASPTRRHGGLGLGLAIVKQLVSAHGGTVHAESEGPGRGSTFTVRLPAKSAAAVVAADPRKTSSIVPRTGNAPRLDGLRVVVVDDEEDALLLVAEVLRERGAEVTCVRSAKDAVDRVAVVRPDVIVSDIGMPEMDGYSLIRRIRSLPTEKGGRTPAVALTAYARTEDAQRAFAAGYQMHVVKPVEPVQLATVVANLGGRSMNDG